MRLNLDQLPGHLKKGLQSTYLLSGDEPLLVMEAGDQIRQQARTEGYTEREVYHVESGFDWNDVLLSGDSMSLFAERKIIEIRLPSGKAGTQGGKVLDQLAQSPPEDTLIMLITGKLDAATRKAKWYRSFESKAVCLQAWPLNAQQLPQWIAERLKQHGLEANMDSVRLLADRVEGNLLAADQEIRKLRMLSNETQLSEDDIQQAVVDSSRHNVFEFIDAALNSETGRLSKMLGNVRAEGGEPPVVLWALAKEFRLLHGVASALGRRQNPDQFFDSMQVWRSRRPLVAAAARRKPVKYWQQCLSRCSLIDRMIKGRGDGNPWDELLQLGIKMAR